MSFHQMIQDINNIIMNRMQISVDHTDQLRDISIYILDEMGVQRVLYH